jgi:hypothetical protein
MSLHLVASAPEPGTPDGEAWKGIADTVMTTAKRVFCPILLAHGITTVLIAYDGCGDDGQVHEITALGADNTPVEIPDICCDRHQTDFHGKVTVDQASLHDALDAFAYEALGAFHDGWENGDGACGDITIDTATQVATLEHNERYTAYNSSSREL